MRSFRLTILALGLAFGCDGVSPIAFVLPSLDGSWAVQLLDVPGMLRIVVVDGRIVQYDQGDGMLQEIEERPPMTQNRGVITFEFQATQAFVGFNNGEPTEFIIAGEGTILQDGAVDLAIRFTSVATGDEGGSNATMRR